MTSTRIIIEAVAPDKMRLPVYNEVGCGDWFRDPETGDIHIQVASTTDVWDDIESLGIAIHELCEARLCAAHGVTEAAVDTFDVLFEQERAQGLHGLDDEPGSDKRAPYYLEHADAMFIEGLFRRFLEHRE